MPTYQSTFMLRHSSPFSAASMLIVLTQMHPLPTVTLTYVHTHLTELLLAFTLRHKHPLCHMQTELPTHTLAQQSQHLMLGYY